MRSHERVQSTTPEGVQSTTQERVQGTTPLLALDDVHAYYGEGHVLQGVSLAVGEGRVLSLLGRNGAGKTTTLKTIMGVVPARRGVISFAGRAITDARTHDISGARTHDITRARTHDISGARTHDITRARTHDIARAGIAYVPETRGIFPSLTVLENLTLAARDGAGASENAWTLERAFELFPRLRERRKVGGTRLSGGEQQMLSIARALLTNPRLLILDEPTEGLAPIVVAEIERILAHLKSTGLAILLVEQKLDFALAFADDVAVLGKGKVRWSGTPQEFTAANEIKHRWLGL